MTRIGIAWALLCLGFGASGASASETPGSDHVVYPTSGVAFRCQRGGSSK